MPKFLKNVTISLIDAGIDSYLLALYGMAMPTLRPQRSSETKYAPIIGLYGASAELIAKACLVQAKGESAMYKDGNKASETYRFGTEVIEDLRKYFRNEDACISFIWEKNDDHDEQRELLIHYLSKFKLLQSLRANGLHAGIGNSRDVLLSTATDIHGFIQCPSRSKRLKPYLRNVPAPEATVRDREAIIEDLSRRMNSCKNPNDKANYLRNMYVVLPYVPEIKPDWIDVFDKIAVSPPTESDLSYLAKTLSDAHSIYLLKNRGGKEGLPVRVDPNNPHALPIAIQNIKRTLSTTPDKFNNDVMTSNTRLEEKRLDLPLEDFIVDLYALGIEDANILPSGAEKLTAQQVWPFVAAAYSSNGTPRPCWFIVRACDDISQLIAYMKRAGECGNGYLRRRMETVLSSLTALINGSTVELRRSKDQIFKEIIEQKQIMDREREDRKNPFDPLFLKRHPLGVRANDIIKDYVIQAKNAGDSLASMLELESLNADEKHAAIMLLHLCMGEENKNGPISVLRTHHLKSYASEARKQMFFSDFITYGPDFIN